MKLEDWLKENRWSVRGFSAHTSISRNSLDKVLHKKSGGINLTTARLIEKATDGKVKIKDLIPENDDDLKKVKRPAKQQKKNEQQIENTEQPEIK